MESKFQAIKILANILGGTEAAFIEEEKQRQQWIAQTRRPNRMSQKKRRQRARWNNKS